MNHLKTCFDGDAARRAGVTVAATPAGLRLDAASPRDLSRPPGLLAALLEDRLPLAVVCVGGVELDLASPGEFLIWRLALVREKARRSHRRATGPAT